MRKKQSRQVKGTTASIVEGENLQNVEATQGFNEQLEQEKAEAQDGKELVKELKKVKEGDVFTTLLKTVLGLKGDPLYKSDFTDTRWPRLDNGSLIVCSRVYYPALEGPREASLGFLALGERETENIQVIFDKIPNDKFWTEERILAKKFVCESSNYRYFYIVEGEEFTFNMDDPKNIFFERFKKLDKEPEFSFGPVNPARDLESEIYGTWQ